MKDAVKVIVYDADGRVLVLRRSDTHPTLPLHPDLPGGDVDPGESLVEAALREVREETGFELSLDGIRHEKTSYTSFGATRALFSATIGGSHPEVVISWEHDQYNWMRVAEFAQLEKPSRPDFFLDLAQQHLLSV